MKQYPYPRPPWQDQGWTVPRDPVLDLGTDLHLRYGWFIKESLAHPAKLHLGLLMWLVRHYVRDGQTIGDPMAGIGSVMLAAALGHDVIIRDVEPGWLDLARQNAALVRTRAGLLSGAIDIAQADARQPWNFEADHIIFSPPYGCASSPNAKTRTSKLKQRLERLNLDHGKNAARWRNLFESSQVGAMGSMCFAYGNHEDQIGHWRGARYWAAMRTIYTHAHAALRSGPNHTMILVIKDHIYRGQHIRVADQTVALCAELGFRLHARHGRRVWPLSLWQRRRKERGEMVIDIEDVLVFHKEARHV